LVKMIFYSDCDEWVTTCVTPSVGGRVAESGVMLETRSAVGSS
jgi:hypothetical protein